jgi:hypothetical protein
MYSQKDLQTEISAKIDWLMKNNGRTLHPEWICQAVMSDHTDIAGRDADFHLCCSRLSVRKEVTQVLNRIDKDERDPRDPKRREQLTLEGFDFVHKYYVVPRKESDGIIELIAVRVDDLTDEEIDRKADEYEAMGRTCMLHADELRRYKALRHQKAS